VGPNVVADPASDRGHSLAGMKVKKNPLAVMLPPVEMEDSIGLAFCFNLGEEDLNPWLKTRITIEATDWPKLNNLIKKLDNLPGQSANVDPQIENIVHVLVNRGFLIKV